MSLYSTQVLADNPYLFYRLDETTYGTMLDSGANALHATHVNTLSIILQEPALVYENDIGVYSNRFTNLGTGYGYGFLDSTKTTSFPSSSITLEAWVKAGTNVSIWKGIFGYILGNTEYVQLALLNNSLVHLKIGGTLVVEGSAVNDGNIHHIVATWENTTGTASIYKDGALDATATGVQVGYIIPSNKELYIGRGLFSSEGLDGWLDSAAIYGSVLSASRIVAHYDAGKTLFSTTSSYISYATGISPAVSYSVQRDYNDIFKHATLPTGSGVLSPPAVKNVEIQSITPTSPTTVRVVFTLPVKRNPALEIPGNYIITPTLGVKSVTPENIANPTYVDLLVDEMKDGENYTIDIHNTIEAA